MPNLINSQRRIPKATYVPLTVPPDAQGQSGRAVEKAAYVRSLNLQPAELGAIASAPDVKGLKVTGESAEAPQATLIDVVRDFVGDASSSALQKYGPALARADFNDLATLGNAVVRARREDAASIRALFQERYSTTVPILSGAGDSVRMSQVANILAPYGGLRDAATITTSPTPVAPSSPALPVPSPYLTIDLQATADRLEALATKTAMLVESFKYQSPIAPVGQIHLERLEMTPVGIEHGELVHSVPLTPKETVNVTHREWSVTTQTFENLTQDFFEGFSETGVAEKNDLAQATDVEAKHSSSLDVNGSLSATYNGGAYSLTVSAAMDYQQKDETQQSEKRSIAHSIAITKAASTRTRKEHKTSFRVSSVAGAEDLAVQIITNPSDTQGMRVDYYQLLRKWRVDLIRYGLRMTYDIAIPNPGFDLITKVIDLQKLNQVVAEGNTFTLDPTTIDRDHWQALEQEFGAVVDPPPPPTQEMTQTASVPQQTYDKWGAATIQFDVPEGYVITKGHFRGLFSLYDYKKDGRHLQVNVLGEPAGTTNTATGEYEGSDAILDFDLTDATVVNRTGTVILVINYHNVDFGDAVVQVSAEPTAERKQAWQSTVWSQLREADQANYEARLALARDRKAQLEAEISAFDALTLRKMEREEVMKWVIQWLLGPNFSLMPDSVRDEIKQHVNDTGSVSGTYAFPSVHDLQANEWQAIVQQGEVIKYLHNAIEWENVIFFSYPYFWDRIENWEFKRFLMHPDTLHREFLRAGAVRVVLPVRPGFEETFAMFMETGDATAPPDPKTYPYVSIGEETRNFAMTNYEGIPPANPDNNVRTLLYPQQRQAWEDIQIIMKALAQYYEDNNNKYPTTLADPQLKKAAQKIGVVLPANDPWNNAYDYKMPGIYGEYDLASHGTKKQPSVDGLDADVNSWAEGSVVGRWYEYTPTSALDVAVTTIPLDQTSLPGQPQPA